MSARDDLQVTENLTRRQLLHGAAVGGAAIGGGALLAACGGSSTTSATTVPGKRKLGGHLIIGTGVSSVTETLDPHRGVVTPDWIHAFNLYDLLNYPYPQSGYELEPHLATEISHNATGDVWTVRLRSGVEFHNGKTLSADDLIFSVHRMLDPTTDSAPALFFIDPHGMKKVDNLTVQFTLPQPYTEFAYAFAASNQFIVPVGFDPKHPIGTGRFIFVDWKPGDHAHFRKNPHYWGEGPYVDEVTTVDINDDNARVAALQSGQIHGMNYVPLPLAKSLDAGATKVLYSPSVAWNPFTMRVDLRPYSDVRVRQAFRLIADRPQLIAEGLLGNGSLANDLYMQYDPVYDHSLPQRHQDIEQAKFLLKQAGYPNGLTVQMTTAEVASGVLPASQVFAQQAKAAGVTINLRSLTTGNFESIANGYFKYPFAVDTNVSSFSYLTTAALWDGTPKAPFSETHFADPEFDKLYKLASQTIDFQKRKQICQDMQHIQWTRGGYIIYAFGTDVSAYRSNVVGAVPDKTGWPMNSYGFRRLSFA